MFEEDVVYTNSIWQVKEGQEENFKSLWEEFAKTGVKDKGALEGILLQDYENPKSFVSFGVWENIESTKQWQNSPEMKSYLPKFDEICNSRQMKTFKSVVKVKK
jgi:quinol monooxygenase YgiN